LWRRPRPKLGCEAQERKIYENLIMIFCYFFSVFSICEGSEMYREMRSENLKEKGLLGNLDLNDRLILKLILEKLRVRV
jgi:hypothetical protein